MLSRLLGELRRVLQRGPGRGRRGATDERINALFAAAEQRFLARDRRGADAALCEALALLPPGAPRRAEALHALGVIAHGDGDARRALDLFIAAIEERPGVGEYHSNCGEAYRLVGNLEDAIRCCREAIALAPGHAVAHLNLGVALQASGRYSEAIAAVEAAIKLDPNDANAHVALGNTLLILGDYDRGLQEYAWRRGLPTYSDTAPRLDQPAWTGAARPGATLLLYSEQGYGDAIQFVRYAPLAAQRCGRVLVKCHAALDTLFSSIRSPSVEVVVSGAALPVYDMHASLLDLPALFGTTIADVPAAVPYLAAPAERIEAWRGRLDAASARLRVGIAWAGNRRHKNDSNRSCTLAHFASLARMEGVVFYAVQKERAEPDAWPADASAPLLDVSAELGDFADTAALIENLDLVISVDTSVAHLAGALGKAVWTLLPRVPDWRWLTEGDETPWYPTMRLFRQRSAGDWVGVFGEVEAALEVALSAAAARAATKSTLA